MRGNNHDLTTGEVAALTGFSVQLVKNFFDLGILAGYRVPGGTFRRIPYRELRRFAVEYAIPLQRDRRGDP